MPTSKGERREGEKRRKRMGKGKEKTEGDGRERRGRTTCISHYF